MTLKSCTCCKKTITTKNVIKIGRDDVAIYLNCAACGSTVILRDKEWKSIRASQIESQAVAMYLRKGD